MKNSETKECESTGTTKIHESADTTSLKGNSVQDIIIQEDQIKQCQRYHKNRISLIHNEQ